MRIFLAVNLSSAVKKSLAELQNKIKNSFPMEFQDKVAKWVAPVNLHLTLLFLGEVGEREIPQLVEIIQKVIQNQPPFALKMKNICYGPSIKLPPRLIWVGIKKNQRLEEIANDLRDACSNANISREMEGEFVGHITLARVKDWVWKRLELEERPEIEKEFNLKIEVHSIDLMESRLKRSAPEYVILQSFPLTGLE